jgi:hypothetical protein
LDINSGIILHILFGYKFRNYLPHFVWKKIPELSSTHCLEEDSGIILHFLFGCKFGKKIPELSSTYCLEEDSGIILHILFGCKFFSSMHYNP